MQEYEPRSGLLIQATLNSLHFPLFSTPNYELCGGRVCDGDACGVPSAAPFQGEGGTRVQISQSFYAKYRYIFPIHSLELESLVTISSFLFSSSPTSPTSRSVLTRHPSHVTVCHRSSTLPFKVSDPGSRYTGGCPRAIGNRKVSLSFSHRACSPSRFQASRNTHCTQSHRGLW